MMLPDNFVEQDLDVDGVTIRVSHGGSGEPLLLLHGYPQTRHMWHRVAPALARHHHVVCADLRGYGDSAKPPGWVRCGAYAKRAMAGDMAAVMSALGHERFALVGHDRGARVAHRLALDHAARVTRLCVMDIAPTRHMFRTADRHFATGYYHWFFLIQPDGLPERLIGADPEYWLREKLRRWAAPGAVFDEGAVREYLRCFRTPDGIRASCDDYRAAADIDLEHDDADFGRRRIECPLLVLWGERGFVHRSYDVLPIWREYAREVTGHTVPCGHFLPEEAPAEVGAALLAFLGDT